MLPQRTPTKSSASAGFSSASAGFSPATGGGGSGGAHGHIGELTTDWSSWGDDEPQVSKTLAYAHHAAASPRWCDARARGNVTRRATLQASPEKPVDKAEQIEKRKIELMFASMEPDYKASATVSARVCRPSRCQLCPGWCWSQHCSLCANSVSKRHSATPPPPCAQLVVEETPDPAPATRSRSARFQLQDTLASVRYSPCAATRGCTARITDFCPPHCPPSVPHPAVGSLTQAANRYA